ncbi:MAG: hypothetical protein V4631_09670 [Pseudomonadota bacterium]
MTGIAAMCAAMLALGGCGMFGTSAPKLHMGDVRLVAAPDANRNSPVVMTVVMVADATLEQRLMAPDHKWFNSAADLAATYPQALQAWYCEFTPGQELRLPSALFDGRRARAVFIIANLSGGERRARIEHWSEGGVISFTRDNWILTSDAKPAAAAARPREIGCSPGSGIRPA